MRLCPLAIAVVATAAVSSRAAAAPLVVVVRESGDDALAVARLRGQLADLDVTLTVARGTVEPALDVQLAAAARLALAGGARAVVWFIAHGGGLSVAVATPSDHRLFVREIPAADPSAVAEAAAVAARGALRALGEGGTIGVEVAPPAVPASRRLGLELAIGWQVALDAGADAGAHAIAQRTSVALGRWAGALALTLGPALHHDAGPVAAVELSRSTAALGIERRVASFALGASAGAAVYHRTTVATSADLAPTPAATTVALVAGGELRWRWRPRGGSVGVDATIGVDVVPGAPELAVARGAEVDALGRLRMVQPRFSVSIVAGLP
jgi:hypothetical protein